jgi:hypothetical protein
MIAILSKIVRAIRSEINFVAEVWHDARAMQIEAERKWHLPRF